jgi:serine/threonine protein kinase/Tol biopolymer transport system component/tetratricopeptide (TPR) repeat protein
MTGPARNLKAIFSEAIAKVTSDDLTTYLDEVCGSDGQLRSEIESLVAAHRQAGVFLHGLLKDEPPPGELPIIEAPGTVIGRYKLLEKIGEGGMAVVYMAEQEQPIRRKVALKIIKLGMDTKQVIARFEAERQALALMDHPGIAKVLDAGATETGRPYFVMELVQGVSITEYCDKNNLSTKDRLALFVQVCNAVQHAHQKGIIHRDIKPSNVMVTHHDGRPVPKVIDFGIAKAVNQRLTEKTLFTRYAHIIGTPAYMSPEQAELSDLDIDTRSDIYSLGVLLYELLTGTTPFSEEELRKAGYIEMQRVIREREPLKPSTKLSTLGDTLTDIAKCRNSTPELLRRTVQGDLDWIVMKSLEKDRAQRYETPSALAEDLRRHLESEPVLARGPSFIYHLRKFLRRHRSQVLATLMLGLLLAAVAVTGFIWNRDRQYVATVILSQAREQYARADRDAALETIQPILHSRHVGSQARLLQATILVDNRQFDEAITLLNVLVGERPEIAGVAHSLLARTLWESESLDAEKLKEIEEHHQKAEMLLPETAEAHFLQAMTAMTIRDQLDALNKALNLDRAHYESRRLRAYTYYASRKYDRLRDDAMVMTILRPRDPLGYSLHAIACRESGRYEEAIADYDMAMALTTAGSPQCVELSIQRSETLLRSGDYQRIIAEVPMGAKDVSPLQYHLLCALTALGDYDKAAVLFRQIVSPGHEARQTFRDWCAKYVFDTLAAGRSWHPPERKPAGAAFLPMIEAEETYRSLSAKGRRLTGDGFTAQWSPDGEKLAFSLGVRGRSGVAVFNLATNQTDLLIVPGKDPRWSPDGRYIAFVRDREVLRLEELATPEHESQVRAATDEEVWVMNSDGTEPRRLARGGWPSWGRDSTTIYYHSRVDMALCSIAIEGRDAEPKQITRCWSIYPSVSPDNQRVAYLNGSPLTVKDLASQAVVAEWPVHFAASGGAGWSANGQELCLAGGRNDSDDRTGLWIYSLDKTEPTRALGGQIVAGACAPDGTKLVFCLGPPYLQIWVADVDANVSLAQSLGPGQTLEEHFQEMLAFYTRRIEADPLDAYAYAGRARYQDCLHDRERADADIRRWSAVVSGRLPHVDLPAGADFTFGEPTHLDVATRFFPTSDCPVSCFSSDGLEMFVDSDLAGGQGFFDIWVLKRASVEDDWGPPENLGPAVNSASMEGFSSISGDGLELYFSSGRSGGYGMCDLYVTHRATRTSPWGPATNLGPKVNGSSDEGMPSVSSDGLELYFSSKRLGGYGFYDIYVSKRETTSDPWGEPVNLGPTVNCPFIEECPCLSPDGLLLLFQAGHRPGGFGNCDLWMTRRASRTAPWEPVVNLGPKINGSSYNCRPCLAPDGSALYFSWQWPDRIDTWQVPIIPIGAPGDDIVKGERDQK